MSVPTLSGYGNARGGMKYEVVSFQSAEVSETRTRQVGHALTCTCLGIDLGRNIRCLHSSELRMA
jgi:hypothetical protein